MSNHRNPAYEPNWEECPECEGTGTTPNDGEGGTVALFDTNIQSSSVDCYLCNGSGRIVRERPELEFNPED